MLLILLTPPIIVHNPEGFAAIYFQHSSRPAYLQKCASHTNLCFKEDVEFVQCDDTLILPSRSSIADFVHMLAAAGSSHFVVWKVRRMYPSSIVDYGGKTFDKRGRFWT